MSAWTNFSQPFGDMGEERRSLPASSRVARAEVATKERAASFGAVALSGVDLEKIGKDVDAGNGGAGSVGDEKLDCRAKWDGTG